jgi:RNA polymerase sigma factor (TIGR02999 family)
MNEVTWILSAIEQGDPSAAEQLLPLVYDELRRLAAAKLAQEKPGQTRQATALVHEAYLRLVETPQAQSAPQAQGWNGRGHFFAAAAEAMRRILVELARSRKSSKRGGRARTTRFRRPYRQLPTAARRPAGAGRGSDPAGFCSRFARTGRQNRTARPTRRGMS